MSIVQGTNVIAGIGRSLEKNANNLLEARWFDHIVNNIEWLRSDTFSWQDGTVYTSAYNHLVADLTGASEQSETIGSYTIYYKLASDGHKICSIDQESTVANIFNESGVAWYYIIDTTNTRFKLPRTKYGFTGLRDGVGNYVPESLPNIKGVIGCSRTLHEYNKQPISSGAIIATPSSQTVVGSDTYSSNVYTYSLDANNYSGVYQDNAPVQERATQMYLYFYVGEFSQTATEQTAGLNAELFNGKADLDLKNVLYSQKNGYEFTVSQETATSGQIYVLNLPKTIDPTKYYVNAYAVIETAIGNFEVGDVIPFSSFWGNAYKNIGFWYNSTKLGFGTSNQLSVIGKGTTDTIQDVKGNISIFFDFYRVKD